MRRYATGRLDMLITRRWMLFLPFAYRWLSRGDPLEDQTVERVLTLDDFLPFAYRLLRRNGRTRFNSTVDVFASCVSLANGFQF